MKISVILGRIRDILEKELDLKTLSEYNGKDGKPGYVAHGERVIDVSASPLWDGGVHMGRHHAGSDLTSDIEAAPHGTEVLDRYPQVAVLRKEAIAEPAKQPLPRFLASFLARHPFFRRHPHPVTAHFPIVFVLSASFFSVLYVLTGNRSFDQTAFYCLAGALLFTPAAVVTGFFTWWINYMARPMRPVTIKKFLSLGMLPVIAGLVTWRYMEPDVLSDLSGPGAAYLLLIVVLSPVVLTIGYFGGTLTFPLEKE